MSVAAVSCSEKKQPSNIIAHKPVKKAPSAPVKMQNSDYEDAVSWIGSSYNVKISRRSDTGLPLIVDDSGNKYYDNVITLSVVRPDGSEFFNRKFTKSDFSSYIGEEYAKKLRDYTIALYKKCADYALTRGIIIADTNLNSVLMRTVTWYLVTRCSHQTAPVSGQQMVMSRGMDSRPSTSSSPVTG